jgi:hypothetical protein
LETRFLAARRREKIEERFASLDSLAFYFTIAWVVILIQGAIRKWMFPNYGIFYLVQDVPIAFAYFYALRKGIVWVGGVMYFSVFLSLILFIQSFLQVIFIRYNILTVMVALHHYIFYIPMLFLIPACMTRKNVRKFLRFNLCVIIPMSLLAFAQALSPRGAWINRTAAGDEIGQAFSVNGVIARSSGTFNFTLPFSVWCGVATALVIGEWLLPPERRSFRSTAFLIANSIAITVATTTSGSRTAVFLAAGAFVGGFISVLLTRNVINMVRFSAVIVAVPVFLLIAYVVAPENIMALGQRFTDEGVQEEMTSRLEQMTVGFILEPSFSLLGHGMGAGIPAAESTTRYLSNDAFWSFQEPYISEWDNIRSVQGLGSVVGVFVVFARYGASIIVLIAAYKALKLPGAESWPHALPIAFTIIPTLAIGDMIHSAPIQAPQVYYCAALICSALLYRREQYASAPLPLMEKAARA